MYTLDEEINSKFMDQTRLGPLTRQKMVFWRHDVDSCPWNNIRIMLALSNKDKDLNKLKMKTPIHQNGAFFHIDQPSLRY